MNMQRRIGNTLERKDARQNPDDEMRELTTELKRIQDGIKSFAEEAKKSHGDLKVETKEAIDKLLVEQTAVSARLQEVEQKLVRRGTSEDDTRVKSTGELVLADEGVQAVMKSRDGRARVNVKAITGLTAGEGGVLVRPQRIEGIVVPPNIRFTVRDLLTPGRTTSSSIEYIRETGFTNSAALVAQGSAKPESGMTFELQMTAVATIAHWVQATKQILSDAPMLQSYIDGRLRYGLQLVEEGQLLKGSGVGGNLNGIYTQASAYAAPITIANATHIDILRLAMLQAEIAEFPASGIVLNPANWASIELTKDTQGRYLFANPQSLVGPTLWGLPVVSTKALAGGEFLVGAFKLGAQIFDREDATVLISTEDRDNFIKNMVTILAEERLGLAVYRPQAFIKGMLPAPV
jgi:HK97 family phage major capsid protein